MTEERKKLQQQLRHTSRFILSPEKLSRNLPECFFGIPSDKETILDKKIALFSLVAERENKRAPYMWEIGSSLNNKLLRRIKEILC